MATSLESAEALASDNSKPIKERFSGVFWLRNNKSKEACDALMRVVERSKDSELLQHDAVYIIGQLGHSSSIPFLISLLHDDSYKPIVRHEAGEALGNFPEAKHETIPELRKHLNSPIDVLATTVDLAIRKLETYNSDSNTYNKTVKGSLEPAEPLTPEKFATLLAQRGKTREQVCDLLADPTLDEFSKYGIVYFFRDHPSPLGERALLFMLDKENRKKTSALIRHEVCFILGQLDAKVKNQSTKDTLAACAGDAEEDQIVRHEAVLSYAGIFGEDEFIEKMKQDPNVMVSQSAKCLQ